MNIWVDSTNKMTDAIVRALNNSLDDNVFDIFADDPLAEIQKEDYNYMLFKWSNGTTFIITIHHDPDNCSDNIELK